jgi:aromatic ring-opening dioxygenase LigB subunit
MIRINNLYFIKHDPNNYKRLNVILRCLEEKKMKLQLKHEEITGKQYFLFKSNFY